MGLPAEGLSAQRIKRRWPDGWKHRLLPGRGMVSDDTEHTCLVGQALLRAPRDPERFARCLAWGLRLWLLGLPAGAMICYLLYQTYLLSTTGQTVGKRLLNVSVVRWEDEGPPGFFRAVFLRCLVPALIALIPGTGLVFLILDPLFILGGERRCLHDWLAGTKVIGG